jgi:hypothetical protein
VGEHAVDIQTGLVIGQVITFLTVIFNAWMASKNTARARKWAEEDEARSAARHAVTQAQVKINTELTQTSVDAAKEAYAEANSVNVKIEKIGLANREALAQAADNLQRRASDKKP